MKSAFRMSKRSPCKWRERKRDFGLIIGGHTVEFRAWTLFHKDSKEIPTHCVCHQALKRPSASEEVDIIKSENDIRFKYAVLTIWSRGTGFFLVEGKKM